MVFHHETIPAPLDSGVVLTVYAGVLILVLVTCPMRCNGFLDRFLFI